MSQIKRNIYSEGNKTGKLHEFRNVFELDPLAHKRFNKFNNARRTQRILNYSGLGLTAAGAITSLVLISENKDDSQSAGLVLGVYGIMAIGPAIILISNPIAGSIKNKRKRNLLDGTIDLSPVYNPQKIEVSVVAQNSGIGVVVHF